MIKFYDSISGILADFNTLGPKSRYWCQSTKSYDLDFYGDETIQQTLNRCQNGDTRLVPRAEAIMTQLDSNLSVPHKVIHNCIAGGWPDVPSFLAGHPLSMRRIEHEASETDPINIYVTTTSTWNVSAEVLMKRGVAILALVMALGRTRAVSLHTITTLNGPKDCTGETVLVTKINTAPLDLATACYMLTSAGFDRRITHCVASALNGFDGPYNYSKSYYPKLRTKLAMKPHDLLLESADKWDPIVTEPVTWVNDQIKKFNNLQTEEEAYA